MDDDVPREFPPEVLDVPSAANVALEELDVDLRMLPQRGKQVTTLAATLMRTGALKTGCSGPDQQYDRLSCRSREGERP